MWSGAALRYLTAGESHGQALVGILEGMPAGLAVSEEYIAGHLKRRQGGYGRGGRMKIESDRARILAGVRHGQTLGSPIGLILENRDWKNWETRMSVTPVENETTAVEIPRPGHADYAGAIKYRHRDIRNVLERASARETAIRVALGSVARLVLEHFDIHIASHVVRIRDVVSAADLSAVDLRELNALVADSPVHCLDKQAETAMMAAIDEAKEAGDSVGGVCEIVAVGLPIGLGSHVHWDRKLDGRIAQAMSSIPAIKGVEMGLGFGTAERVGSRVHDEIVLAEPDTDAARFGFARKTNNAGGLEGGITNGEPLMVRIAMKPLSTLIKPLDSVNLYSQTPAKAHVERTDTCAVPAAGVVGEGVLALVLADAFLEKYGNDSLEEIEERYDLAPKL